MKNFPDALIGRTIERKPLPGEHPDPEVLHLPLESPESVAREYCTSCGLVVEVNETFLGENGMEKSDLETGDYLETNLCPSCPMQENPTERVIRKRNIREFAS